MAFIVKPSQECIIKDLPRARFPFGREIWLLPHVFFKKPSQAPLYMIFDSLKEKDFGGMLFVGKKKIWELSLGEFGATYLLFMQSVKAAVKLKFTYLIWFLWKTSYAREFQNWGARSLSIKPLCHLKCQNLQSVKTMEMKWKNESMVPADHLTIFRCTAIISCDQSWVRYVKMCYYKRCRGANVINRSRIGLGWVSFFSQRLGNTLLFASTEWKIRAV